MQIIYLEGSKIKVGQISPGIWIRHILSGGLISFRWRDPPKNAIKYKHFQSNKFIYNTSYNMNMLKILCSGKETLKRLVRSEPLDNNRILYCLTKWFPYSKFGGKYLILRTVTWRTPSTHWRQPRSPANQTFPASSKA